jgi:D-alanyl-lipoteichoic acid acyltransferase DltB (MBOAT superfamily)
MLAALISAYMVWSWADQPLDESSFSIKWTVAESAQQFTSFSYTWTLAAIAALLVVAVRKESYLMVLGLGSMAFYFRNHPAFALYFMGVTAVLYPVLYYGGKWKHHVFWTILILTTLVIPKSLYFFGYSHPGTWNWINDIGLTGLLLRYAYFYYEQQRGLFEKPGYFEHLSYLAFVPQITANLNFSPSAQWQNHGDYPGVYLRGWRILGLALFKLLCFKCLLWIHVDIWSPSAGIFTIWAGALLLHLKWFLFLSLHYDLSVALCRFLGADLPGNFNFPLLAPSYIEQWRRWNIFNRKLLLKFFYFPFGGTQHHRMRNVFIVFAASAILLHSGWFATKWPTVTAEYLIAWLLFAFAQAVFVCVNMSHRDNRGLDGHHWPTGFAYVKGLLFTQLSFAWLRLLVMGTGCMPGDDVVSLSQRLATMGRAFGLPL